jgi:hypothetical protein
VPIAAAAAAGAGCVAACWIGTNRGSGRRRICARCYSERFTSPELERAFDKKVQAVSTAFWDFCNTMDSYKRP